MIRRFGVFLMAGMFVLFLAVPVAAKQLGDIYVDIDSGLTDVCARRLVLYRVGDESDEGYILTEEFGGGLVSRRDAMSPHLAQMLSVTQPNAGSFRLIDADNTAHFANVEPGLYLLAEEGEDPMLLPTMTAVPDGDRWQVMAYPAVRYYAEPNPGTGQHPAPYLGAAGMVISGIGLALCARVKKRK